MKSSLLSILVTIQLIILLNTFSTIESLRIQNMIRNPDQPAASSGGGDSGEFIRRHQPQEHLFIPLINKQTGDYNPFFNTDIKIYRKENTKLDSNIKFLAKLEKANKDLEMPDYSNDIELDSGIDQDINDIFKAIEV